MATGNIHNKLEHPCFPQPKETDGLVWRYLDVAKFAWMLSNRKSWFSRLDLLNDPLEGSTPSLAALSRDVRLLAAGVGKFVSELHEINRNIRNATYVNCWHLGQSESEAMWRVYCPSGVGLAIQTTYNKLVDSTMHDPELYIGCVTYIHHDFGHFPEDNVYYRSMHKGLSFSYESEVRLVKILHQYMGIPTKIGPQGLEIENDFDSLVDAIVVSPYAPNYYFDAVQAIVNSFSPNLTKKISWSKTRREPLF